MQEITVNYALLGIIITILIYVVKLLVAMNKKIDSKVSQKEFNEKFEKLDDRVVNHAEFLTGLKAVHNTMHPNAKVNGLK